MVLSHGLPPYSMAYSLPFPPRKCAAEFLGTLVLTLTVGVAIAQHLSITPLVAAFTLGIFVYTVGSVSGAHLNPAVTIGLLSVRQIKGRDALCYVVAQFLGAVLALVILRWLLGSFPDLDPLDTPAVGVAETVGAFLLVFGICAVAYGQVHEAASGIAVGGSLLLGAYLAMSLSNAILNPAVALGVGSFSIMYAAAPVVGAILAAQLYQWISQH